MFGPKTHHCQVFARIPAIMISPQELTAKATRLYPRAIKAWLTDELQSFFPYRVPADLQLPREISAAIRDVDALREAAKQTRGFGYSIRWKTRQSRSHGLNQFPTAITIETMDDLVRLIGKSREWEILQIAAGTLRRSQPILNQWLCEASHWKILVEIADSLDDLLSVVEHFQANPRPDCFARELPLAISTKLIENHRKELAPWLDRVLPPQAIDTRYGYDAFEPRYGLRYVRPHFLLRLLDQGLRDELALPFDELSLPAESLTKLPVDNVRVLVVENKVNLLTLPPLSRGLALGGMGNAVTQLSDIGWLDQNPVHYWGDLDAEGFEILSRLRERLPHVKSFLMDATVFESLQHLAIQGNASSRENAPHLNGDERQLYNQLRDSRLRIEQERVPNATVAEAYQTFSSVG